MASNIFINPLTLNQIEKLRLLLSTCQDGTGQLAAQNGLTLPGWRDFERAVAIVEMVNPRKARPSLIF